MPTPLTTAKVASEQQLEDMIVCEPASLPMSLPTLRASLPEAWWWVADDVPAQVSWDAITDSLERCRRADFWNLP